MSALDGGDRHRGRGGLPARELESLIAVGLVERIGLAQDGRGAIESREVMRDV